MWIRTGISEFQGWHIGIGRYGQYRQNRYIGIGSSTSADV